MDIKKLIKLQNAIIRAHQKIKDVQNDSDLQTKEIKDEFKKEFNGLNKALEQLNKELDSFTKKEELNKHSKELEQIKGTLNEVSKSIDEKISKIQLKHGKDGINGIDGKDGRDGKDGTNGRDGKDGKDGANGLSAYEIAVKQGFEGTEEEWIEHITNNGGKDYSGQIAAMNQRVNKVSRTIKTDGTGNKYLADDGTYKEVSGSGEVPEDVLTQSSILRTIEECEQCQGENVPSAGLLAKTYNSIPKTVGELENDEGFVTDADLSNYYNKDEINNMANGLMSSMPEIVPMEEYNPEEQYADNQVANANTFNYLVGQVTESFNEVYNYIEEVGQKADEKIFDVNYNLNPQNMSITYISHYSTDIINAYNEGKKVTFRGYVLGLNVYVTSELQLVDGDYAYTYPLLKVNLGQGEKTYLFKIQVSSSSASVEMNEMGGDSGTDENIFIVEYNVDLANKQVTNVSKTQQEIINAHNEGKKVMFRGSVTGVNAILISELNTIDSNIPYTYPFLRTDLGEGIYNYFFRISVYREYGSVEPYAFVDTIKLNQTVETLNSAMSNLAMSRPDSNTVVNIVNFYLSEAMSRIQNRLLPETADEGTTIKYVEGQWTTVQDDTFIVEYQLNPQNMSVTSITHYSSDIINAYDNGKKVSFKGYVLGLNVYVNSELEIIDGNYVATFPLLRVDLGQGMMNYLFRLGINTSSAIVEVRVLQDIG